MTKKDLDLLEKLLEEFCAKSDCCNNCSFKNIKDERHFCYGGINCILKELNFDINQTKER